MNSRAALRFARSIVLTVISIVNTQINRIQQEVFDLVSQWVEYVVGGIWIGKGANAFVEEMQSEVLPLLMQLIGSFEQTNKNIHTATDIIDQADLQVSNKANSLADVFERIY